MNEDLLLSSYNYQLPSDAIAQKPAIPRDSSRMLVVNSHNNHIHSIFRHLPHWLLPGDLLVFNDTRVIPARLYGQKSTGATVEILLLEEKAKNLWLALVKPGKRFTLGTEIIFTSQVNNPQPQSSLEQSVEYARRQTDNATSSEPSDFGSCLEQAQFEFKAKVVARDEATGGRILQFELPCQQSFWQILDQFGEVPLPPYITDVKSDRDSYQTVYAKREGL